MQVRQAYRDHGRRHRLTSSLCLAGVILGSLAVGGCGQRNAPAASHPVRCGKSRSAANVPVMISVNSTSVSCSAAMTVESGYATAIREGKAPGASGDGPVKVNGWTCTAFPTPKVLKTGDASKCVKGTTEILATLTT
jgi:hypothetical protein